MPTLNDKKKKKLAFPSSILMLFIIIVIITILTWIVPGGSFDRVLDEETGQTTVVPDSFQYTEKTPVGPFDMFVACLLYTSPSPRDRQKSRMPSSA